MRRCWGVIIRVIAREGCLTDVHNAWNLHGRTKNKRVKNMISRENVLKMINERIELQKEEIERVNNIHSESQYQKGILKGYESIKVFVEKMR